MADQQIVAVGLLTQADIDRLGSGFSRLFPVQETPCFGELLLAIDDADRALTQRTASPNHAEGVSNG